MFRKNTMFIKILIPLLVVMIVQTALVGTMLFATGTVDALEDSALETLSKNAENRGSTLESAMVNYWSNIYRLDNEINVKIAEYIEETGVTVDEILESDEIQQRLLYDSSEALLNVLRTSNSTGVFIYFTDGSNTETPGRYNGLYYRDLDPTMTPADYSDVIFMRGRVDVARKDNIPLDSSWSEHFSFTPEQEATWRGFVNPINAALQNSGSSANNLAFWNTPHYVNAGSGLDSNECITYSRPIFFGDRLVGVIGTEVQVSQIIRHIPPSDFGETGQGGYILMSRDTKNESQHEFDVHVVTGSYIKRLIGAGKRITLAPTEKPDVYDIAGGSERVKITMSSLHLYNSHTPFSNEQWFVASVATDAFLFEPSRRLLHGLVLSFIIALSLGVIGLAVITRITTRPLISIAKQIERLEESDVVIDVKSNTYELVLLSETINFMINKRKNMEMALREERERYLVALESTEDTIVEYAVDTDNFTVYYFDYNNKHYSDLTAVVIDEFMSRVERGEVCHKSDKALFKSFLRGNSAGNLRIRIKTTIVSHVFNVIPDGEYFWFSFKASCITDEDGAVVKTIGLARQITEQMREENSRLESARRDVTTKLYNREYGLHRLKSSSSHYGVCVLHIRDYDVFETYYGRIFGSVVLMRIGAILQSVLSDESDIVIRMGNDEFLLCFANYNKKTVKSKIERIKQKTADLYIGENPDLKLNMKFGIAYPATNSDNVNTMERAYQNLSENRTYKKQKPIAVSIDVSKDNVVAFALEFFERTADLKSTIKLLMCVLGDMFSLSQIVICSYSEELGANNVAYQWCKSGELPYKKNIEKIAREDFLEFESLLDENGVALITGDGLPNASKGVKTLLCLSENANDSEEIYCCATYENGINVGRVIFKKKKARNSDASVWNSADMSSLYEVVKIIAAHISIDKSNFASRAKSEFLSRMSHEIRTPMNAIIGMTRIAKESAGDAEKLKASLDKIDFSANHLLALINDILDMSRIESGKMKIESEKFSLKTFIETIDILVRPQIEVNAITLSLKLDVEHTAVVGDEYRLRQVIVNLLSNAGKFTEPGGKVDLIIEEVRDCAPGRENCGVFRFTVKDTGIGISQEDQSEVFKAFEQARVNNTAKNRSAGTGLGLAISTNLVASMGGKIELVSELGKGSTFFFTLELELADESETQEIEVNRGVRKSLKGTNILLAEDIEVNIEIAKHVLENAGCVVDVAMNGQEALEKFKAAKPNHYDIILMDIQMPVMDGLTATKEIRKCALDPRRNRKDAATIPIIAMTANAFDDDTKRSVESGMNGHISKPFEVDRLFAIIESFLPD